MGNFITSVQSIKKKKNLGEEWVSLLVIMDMVLGYKPVYQIRLLLLITCLPHPTQEILFSSVKMYCNFLNDRLTWKPDDDNT